MCIQIELPIGITNNRTKNSNDCNSLISGRVFINNYLLLIFVFKWFIQHLALTRLCVLAKISEYEKTNGTALGRTLDAKGKNH